MVTIPADLKWYIGVVVATTFLIVFFSGIFSLGLPRLLAYTESEIHDISKTILSIDATLFGLSMLSGAIFLDIMNRKKEDILRSRVLDFIAVSFLCFWFALLTAFITLLNPINRTAFLISIGSTLSGSLSGSLYLAYVFREFLRSRNR